MRVAKPVYNQRQFRPLPILPSHRSHFGKPQLGHIKPHYPQYPRPVKPYRPTLKPRPTIGLVGPPSTWPKKGGTWSGSTQFDESWLKGGTWSGSTQFDESWLKGGSWESKWWKTNKQNKKRREKLRKKCVKEMGEGDLGKKYRNNCKKILPVPDYLSAVRRGVKVIESEHA